MTLFIDIVKRNTHVRDDYSIILGFSNKKIDENCESVVLGINLFLLAWVFAVYFGID